MRSSESTPSPRERPIRLSVVIIGDDHPRACTGRRLLRLGLAEAATVGRAPRERTLVLDPFSEVPLTARDRARADRGGLTAVDCSWNALSAAHSLGRPGAVGAVGGTPRRLPMLVATNPQHYGRVGELNTAEALAAALFVLGNTAQARTVLDGFAGAAAFFTVNAERLRRYARGATAEALRADEQELFAPAPAPAD